MELAAPRRERSQAAPEAGPRILQNPGMCRIPAANLTFILVGYCAIVAGNAPH
jgi:hypothetical protein